MVWDYKHPMARMFLLLLALPLVVLAAEAADEVAAEDDPTVLVLEGVPPSPALHPGERIWPDPSFTHWPAVVYHDERRNAAFRVPIREPEGGPATIAWAGEEPIGFTVPPAIDGDSVSGLVDLPASPATHRADLTLPWGDYALALRIVPVDGSWPHAGLRNGFPVDADGVPVVLRLPPRDPGRERRWAALRPSRARGTGPAVALGDDLRALGRGLFEDLAIEYREARDPRYPQHAILVAAAELGQERTVVVSPGNAALFAHTTSGEELRLLEAIDARYLAAGTAPRRILILPPVPLPEELVATARSRRQELGRHARTLGWTILDVEAEAGPAAVANRVAEALFTRYPQGRHQERVRDSLAALLTE